MKKHLILLWLSALPLSALADSPEAAGVKPATDSIALSDTACPAEEPDNLKPEEDKPLVKSEVMPEFMGGNLMKFRTWVMQRLRYPKFASKNYIEGRVLIRFVVNREGEVCNVEVVSSPHESLTDEAIRVISMSPKWTPGEQGGKKVNVHFIVPIDFSL